MDLYPVRPSISFQRTQIEWEAAELQKQLPTLTPLEGMAHARSLQGRVDLLKQQPMSRDEARQIRLLSAMVARLILRLAYPIYSELESSSSEGEFETFAFSLKAIQRRLLRGHSLAPLAELSEEQREKVVTLAGGQGSPEGIAHGIDLYLKHLKGIAHIGALFYEGDIERGMEGIWSLPEGLRGRLDQLLWEANGGEALDVSLSHLVVAEALFHLLEQEMGISF